VENGFVGRRGGLQKSAREMDVQGNFRRDEEEQEAICGRGR